MPRPTLEEHVAVCDERYKNIESRLTNLEHKVDEIHKEIDGFKNFIIKLAMKSGGGIIVALAATVWAIKF